MADDRDIWVAHDQPMRQLAYGAWLCVCDVCYGVLRDSLYIQPGLEFVIKAACGRTLLSGDELLEAWDDDESLSQYLRGPGDYIRELFVAA